MELVVTLKDPLSGRELKASVSNLGSHDRLWVMVDNPVNGQRLRNVGLQLKDGKLTVASVDENAEAFKTTLYDLEGKVEGEVK